MKSVITIQELKKALYGESQNYKTRCGWIEFEGRRIYVRKHWSYDGGFPAYADERCVHPIGELFAITESAFPYVIDGKVQCQHNVSDWIIYDFKLKFVPDVA